MDERAAGPERDPRFPSGSWTGFFLQYWLPGRQPTAVALAWAGGEVDGAGRDRVGPYTVAGTYDPATGRCGWTKRYQSLRGRAPAGHPPPRPYNP